ncbi:MAG: ABC transporter ATP-binding protein [Blautia sp.]|nr:ABC transporter ATP-binding protein [Blautia sp.]
MQNIKEGNETLLEIRDFGFQYTAQAEPTLYDINLTVRKGEKILIIGPSGCGKSTLASCINGLIPFSFRGEMSGSFRLKGRETQQMSLFEISHIVGTVLQDSDDQFIGLTVAEDIAFALENDEMPTEPMHELVKKTAELVGVGNHLNHAPGDISGGQKQRTALAGVMVNHVDLLLFDEPLANLDPATGKQAVELIDEMCAATGAAVLIIEHRLEDALHRNVDRVILMNEGRILADLSPDELLCTDLLRCNGIREPLYLTALKYAGVKITPEMEPWNIRTLHLTPDDKSNVQRWVKETRLTDRRAAPEVLLSARDLCFAYANGTKALNGVSLNINKGELMAIVGTNGAGKSTFSKVLCGFETPQSGTITFSGIDNWMNLSIKERADHVGYVMQNPNQMISQTLIFDEIALGLRTRGISEEEIIVRVEHALKVCGLWPFRRWPVSALSYGQKKRVTIASILVLEPEMIILDEPTAGQDYRHYTDIMEFLRSLAAKGIAVVMITHDMHLMLEYAVRTAVFSEGRLIACDTGAAILTDPDIIRQASLKETSLYALGQSCDLEDPRDFVRFFIDYEREVLRS